MSIDGLVLFIGVERASKAGIHIAEHDMEVAMKQGLPPLYYQDIPYIPAYAAAGDEIQFGLVLANGQVRPALHWLL